MIGKGGWEDSNQRLRAPWVGSANARTALEVNDEPRQKARRRRINSRVTMVLTTIMVNPLQPSHPNFSENGHRGYT